MFNIKIRFHVRFFSVNESLYFIPISFSTKQKIHVNKTSISGKNVAFKQDDVTTTLDDVTLDALRHKGLNSRCRPIVDLICKFPPFLVLCNTTRSLYG